MLRDLTISVFGLVYLTLTAHCTEVKRSALSCTSDVANEYCKYIKSSRNRKAECEDGAVVCHMTSTTCSNAADCEDACRPWANTDIFVQPQCVSSSCHCGVSDLCTQSNCQARCGMENQGNSIESWECMPNNTCICFYSNPCTGEADCRSLCEQRYPGKNFSATQCGSDHKCLCEYGEECTSEAHCKSVCEKTYPGKQMLSTNCRSDKQCLCTYLDGGAGTAVPACMLTIATIFLTNLA